MSRKVFCEKDGIIITYTDNDVCFEDSKNYLTQIYQSITAFRNLDALESA